MLKRFFSIIAVLLLLSSPVHGAIGKAVGVGTTGGGATQLDQLTDVDSATSTSGNVLVGNGAGAFDSQAISGDVTMDGSGVVSIGTSAVGDNEINFTEVTVGDFTNDSGYASQLSELSDVSSATDTAGHAMVATGSGWTSKLAFYVDGSGNVRVTITVTITKPLNLDEADTLPIFKNFTGLDFEIDAIYSDSDTDDTVYTLKEAAYTDYSSLTTIEAITIDTNGTDVFYDDLTSGIDHTTIEDTHVIVFDNDDTDDPDYISFTIVGHLE